MSFQQLTGVLPIIQTPFDDQGRIDWKTLESEVNWAFSIGIAGLGTGMVSEVRSMSEEERAEFARKLVEAVDRRGPVFMAVTADCQEDSVRFAKAAAEAGCTAIMAAPPLKETLDADGFYGYFARLADTVEVPVIVQDASSYMGAAIPHSVYRKLLEKFDHEKIVFKPEAPPNGPCISALRDATQGKARIFEGSGGVYLIDSMRRGVEGTMPGMDLADGIVAVWQAMKRNDDETAYRIHLPICSIVSLQMQAGLDGFLAIEKYLLKKRGIFPNENRREPVRWQLDRETADEVDRLFDRLQRELLRH
jgi:4-hydroxy-tetrahydrodipicolinate synthase